MQKCDQEQLLARISLTVYEAICALKNLESEEVIHLVKGPVERGYFQPDEQEDLRRWFGKFLTARSVLHESINDLRKLGIENIRSFAVAFAAACSLVRASRYLVVNVSSESIVQRKLNEPVPDLRIPGKQFTAIRKSLTSPKHAWLLLNAKNFAQEHEEQLNELIHDSVVGSIGALIPDLKTSIEVEPKDWLLGRIRYRIHGFRRRNKVALERAFFAIAELSGRVIAELKLGSTPKITTKVRDEIIGLLQAGDIVVSRHDGAASNYFLPGYWPHASLFVNENLFLEARKDGVRLREPDDTLSVDAVVIIRPKLNQQKIQEAIQRAMSHEGKSYNFDFDFFNDERLVCTEVVYRAYQGIDNINFDLSYRAGRPSLSAEDILEMAKKGTDFNVIALSSDLFTNGKLLMDKAALDALTVEESI